MESSKMKNNSNRKRMHLTSAYWKKERMRKKSGSNVRKSTSWNNSVVRGLESPKLGEVGEVSLMPDSNQDLV